MRPDAGELRGKAKRRYALAAFCIATGFALASVVAVFVLREWLAPPLHTWSVWTGTALVLLALIAVALWAIGALLSIRVHRARRDSVSGFLNPAEREQVAAAIREFEQGTSGEIRVHVCERTPDRPPTAAAAHEFERMGMASTRDRNGVLFFVSVRDRRLAVIGDRGIHAVVPPDFWATVIARVEAAFGEGRYADGLVEGIRMAGTRLTEHFPRRADDVNELPDSITES